jgi:uncharacterized protein (TIGR02246 family)
MFMKIRSRIAGLLAILTFFFTSCSAPDNTAEPLDLAKAKTDIQAMEDAFAAAEKAKDADAVAAYYADDAISYSRNKPPAVGKAAIRESIAQQIAKDTTGNYNVYKVVDLFGEGNMLVEIGSWRVLNPSGAEIDKGHYMSYFQKKDGKYTCVRDMNVSSNPAKPAM